MAALSDNPLEYGLRVTDSLGRTIDVVCPLQLKDGMLEGGLAHNSLGMFYSFTLSRKGCFLSSFVVLHP